MAKKQFKSESKRLLDLMINSIYTHKEIFLRELISNANDAIDKLYYLSLTDESVDIDKDDLCIRIDADKNSGILRITDNGIGMTKEDLEKNLGTIARSGSYEFKKNSEANEEIDIIGQFGVGFYSAFMVADHIVVNSKAFGSDEAYSWASSGADGYEIMDCDKQTHGTEIIIKLKENTEDEKYDEFVDQFRIYGLVKKYSDYIKYPIKMMMAKTKPAEKEGEKPVEYMEEEILNSMVPIWRKNKSELSDEDYNNFYKEKFFDFTDPVKVIHTSADGAVSYNALMFIPERPSYDYYTKEYKKGLQLYTNGVLIMDKCEDLLPDCFGFVKGLVDSADLSLNISREMLQHDRQLKAIASHLKKKIKTELESMLKKDREAYESFYENFKRPLKFGLYDNYGADKDFLCDLVMFYSSTVEKLATLNEYVERMKEDQQYIYYACGESIEKISKMPQIELMREKGYEILFFTEDVDEFAVKVLAKYNDKEFKSISDSDLNLDNAEVESKDEDKALFELMKEALDGKVVEVKASSKLKSYPVCVSSAGEITIEMEKVLSTMPGNEGVKAQRVLEINTEHSIFAKLKSIKEDKDALAKYTKVLYTCALMTDGVSVDDPTEFTEDLCSLID
ncbi:MAG: molecular chaperone HtpG [Eubacteriales bacterium]|nr:molecular chaperone HtpG [Eubacteriales bacterium]